MILISLKNIYKNKQMDIEKEWTIQAALFKATVEQNSMLIGTTKQQTKMIFKRWMQEGNKILKILEENSDADYLEGVTEKIENSVNEIRNK